MTYLYSKAHLEQAIAQAKIEVPATSKIWDAYRAYEKRLTASREKGTLSILSTELR